MGVKPHRNCIFPWWHFWNSFLSFDVDPLIHCQGLIFLKYLSEFEELFFHLVDYPEIGRSRNEIKKGLRSLPKSAHVVFYRIMANHIRIVRILHGSKDITQFLE